MGLGRLLTGTDPSPDEARAALRRELLRPEYYRDDLLQRVLDWIDRTIGRGVEGASRTPALTWLAITLVVVLLVLGLGLLVSRARRSARVRDDAANAVLGHEAVSADELRARAERALAEGRCALALVDGFRAVAERQVERGRLDDSPGATAHEVARALGGEFPDLRARVEASASLFDAVLYGERDATSDQAGDVLRLDDDLSRVR